MNWFAIALLSAVFAAGNAVMNKAALRKGQLECTIGTINFFLTGIVYLSLAGSEPLFGNISLRLWQLILLHVGLEIVGVWCMLRALSLAEISFLGPFVVAINIGVLFQAYVLLDELPSPTGMFGVLVILAAIAGMLLLSSKRNESTGKNNLKALKFFVVSFGCWIFTPVIRKLALNELAWMADSATRSVFFAAILCLVISLAFYPLIFIFKEPIRLRGIQPRQKQQFFAIVIASSILFALGIWCNYTVLDQTMVIYAQVLQDIKALLAAVVGILIFRERELILVKISATVVAMIGACLIAIG